MLIAWMVVAACIAGGLLADFIYRRYASGKIREIVENVPTFAAVPTRPLSSATSFRISVDEDVELEACLHLPPVEPAGVILFCPELHGNHWTALHYCPALLDAGYALLAFDFRNQGNSSVQEGYDPIHWVTEFEMQDVAAVLRYVGADDQLRHLPVGVFGVSRGGSVALAAACRHSQIQAVAVDSAYAALPLIRSFMYKFSRYVVPDWFFARLPAWHIDVVLRQALARSERRRRCRYVHLEDHADRFEGQALLITGARDSYVTPRVTNDISEIFSFRTSTWTVPRAKHNRSRERAAEEYDSRIVSHFRAMLPVSVCDRAPAQPVLHQDAA